MRKLLAIIITGLFAVSSSAAFAADHAKGEKGDMKKDEKKSAMKKDEKKSEAKKDEKKAEMKKDEKKADKK